MVMQSKPVSPINSMRKGLLRVSQALNRVRRSFAALRKRSSRMSDRSALSFGFDLTDRDAHQINHFAANLMVGFLDALGIEIPPDLAENVVTTGNLEVGFDHLLRIGLGFLVA